MPPALQQDIRVVIETVLKGNPQFAVFTQNVEKVKQLDGKKVELGNASNAQQLAASIDNLAAAVEKLDDQKVGRLGKAFHFLGTAAQILGHLKGAKEGIEVIRDVINTSPNLANFTNKLSGAASSVGSFFSALKDKAAAGIAAAKTKVSELAASIPELTSGLGSAASAALGVGAAGAAAAAGIILIVGAVAAVVAALVAIPIVAVKLFELASAAAETGSKFHDLAQETGASVEFLSGLAPAAEDSSSSIEELAKSLGKFNKLVGDANRGGKEATETLLQFGIKPREAIKDQEAALEKVFKRILELPPGIQRVIAAQEVFGAKTGAKMVPIIETLNGKVKETIQRTRELGLLWTNESANAADEFGDRVAELNRIVEGFKQSIAVQLIPAILQLLRIFTSEAPIAGGIFQNVLKAIAVAAQAVTLQLILMIAAAKTLKDLPAIIGGTVNGGPAVGAAIAAGAFQQNLAELLKVAFAPSPAAPPVTTELPGGGGGGGGGKKSKPADTFDSVFGFEQKAAESALTLLKDSLERQRKAVKESFDKRKTSISDYYDEEYRLQKRSLDFEIESTKKAILAQKDRLTHKVERINKDESLDEAEKAAQIEIETKQTETEIVGLNEKLILLLRDRQELGEKISKAETEAQRALQDSLQPIIDQIDRANGKGALVDSREQIAKLNEKIEELRNNGQTAAADLVEEFTEFLNVLAQIRTRVDLFERSQAVNEARINRLREEGQRNIVAQFLAEQQINEIRRQQLKAAEQLLRELEEVAKTQTDPAILVEIEKQREAVARLRNQYRTLGGEIKDTFINSVGQAFEDFILSINDVIAGTKSLGDAFRQFALSVIQELERLIAKMIAVKILAAIIGLIGGGSGSEGGLGSAIGGVLGGEAATGGEFSANPGGRIIRVAEAGHDELVVTTDPRHAKRTASLLGRFVRRTGILPDFSAGSPSRGILSNIAGRISSFAAGDFVSAPSLAGAGAGGFGPISLTVQNVFPNVSDARGFNLNQQAIIREAGRAIEKGLRRAGRSD